jgi:hypothetical protein
MPNSLIYQQLSGRLGNQLFQWAYSHQLNSKYQMKIVPFHDKSHAELGYQGNLEVLIKSCSHADTARQINSFGFLLKIFDKLRSYQSQIARRIELICGIFRATNHFEISLPGEGRPRIVTGFFVNWKSVSGVEEILFNELTEAFKEIKTPSDLPKEYQVIHVRRGDFLELKDSYGILHPEYYLANADRNLTTFVCTDDKEMAQDIQSRINVQKVFGPDDLNPTEAMKLMANASLLLMSNSTLSWWAGFYCSRKGGKAVIPKPFYKIEANGSLYHPDFTTAHSVFY